MEGVITIGAAEVPSDLQHKNYLQRQRHQTPSETPSPPLHEGAHREHLERYQRTPTPSHRHRQEDSSEPHPFQNGQGRHSHKSTGDSHSRCIYSPLSEEKDMVHLQDDKLQALEARLDRILEDNQRINQELDRSQRRVRQLRREKNLLLDRLSTLERRDSGSGTDSDDLLSSDSRDSDSSSVLAEIRARQIIALRESALYASREALRASNSGPNPKSKGSPFKKGGNPKSSTAPKDSKPNGPSAPVASTITNVGSATQKPKRIHQSNKPRIDLNKVRKVVALPRDENGLVKLPVNVGILTVWSTGHVVYDREAFHNERYIWPVGYKVSRSYNSMVDPTKQTIYTCSVIDDGEAPKFQIDAEDQPGSPIIAGTATGAWTHIVKAANLIRRRDHSNSASGPDYYGFSNDTIAKMIQELPDAEKCTSYIRRIYEEVPSTSVVGSNGAGEKRKMSVSARGKKMTPTGQELPGGDSTSMPATEETEEVNGNGDDNDDDDAYTSLGTPGMKRQRIDSPKIRQAGFGDVGSATMSMETENVVVTKKDEGPIEEKNETVDDEKDQMMAESNRGPSIPVVPEIPTESDPSI
ncbi:hypothetical protein EMPS_08864 [Entomortierella parvispora]|uniref:FYR N-terminal domain-containing protein n=1 Tax=Entomortierella parvispora TaxID=205924 RepID=A0A9P3HH86_9FUNG|nr:hypothetical protein EMPS_08864 [Entomortierella parvispora]